MLTTFVAVAVAALGSTGESAPQTYLYLKPAAAPVPATCAGAKAVQGMIQVPLEMPGCSTCPVARVGDDLVGFQELADAVSFSHEQRPAGAKSAPRLPPDNELLPVLQRVIDARLVVAEAEGMGLGEREDVKKALAENAESALRYGLEAKVTEGVEPDPAEVDRIYKGMVREWNVRTVRFEKKDAAKAFLREVKGGKPFETLAAKVVAAKKGKSNGDGEWVSAKDALPQVTRAVAKAKPGSTVGPVEVPGGFAALKVVEIRYPENPAARSEARGASLAGRRKAALVAYYQTLVKKYAVVDKALLAKIDWEAKKPGYAAYEKDTRPLATIQGENPITVADLSAAVLGKFYHGLEGPIRDKRVNQERDPTFTAMLSARLFLKEARAQSMQETEGFRRAMAEHRRGLLFSAFVTSVIIPGVKVTEKDAMSYFEEHKNEFTYPQMYRLEALAFSSAKDAQSAIDRLKGGADLQWMQANAEGQLPAGKRILVVDPAMPVSANSLPEGLAKALAGARPGEYRLYAASDAQHYVVRVVDDVPPKVQPYLEVREKVARIVEKEAVLRALQEYAGKLRAATGVEIFLARIGS